jgi:hypothetical protein
MGVILALTLVGQVSANWKHNDYSNDTAINDYYENVYDLLPQGSALLGRGGVFGFDMFYFRLVYNYRPDIVIPMIEGPQPLPEDLVGRPTYATQPVSGGGGGKGPWAPPPGLVPRDAWSVPVLLGQSAVGTGMQDRGQPLVLYEIRNTPPELATQAADPEYAVGGRLKGLRLVGYDLDDSLAYPGGRLHLALYWRVQSPPSSLIVTSLGDTALESHQLGLGNLARYAREVGLPDDSLVVEEYWVVIPSTVAPGDYPLRASLQSPLPRWAEGGSSPADKESIELGQVSIVD